jgi:hypothetical protein
VSAEADVDDKKPDTTEYSASKAPETKREAEERETVRDFRLIPGGKRGSEKAIGMSAMDREEVPNHGENPNLEKFGDSPDIA